MDQGCPKVQENHLEGAVQHQVALGWHLLVKKPKKV